MQVTIYGFTKIKSTSIFKPRVNTEKKKGFHPFSTASNLLFTLSVLRDQNIKNE